MPTAKLDVAIGANDEQFQRTMKGVESRAKKLGDSIAKIGGIAGGAALAGGAVAIAAIGKSMADVNERANSVFRTFERTGIATDKLQGFAYGARDAGVEMDRANDAIVDFGERVADAVNGGGELREVMEKYSISAKNADGSTRKLWDVLGDVSDAMAGTTDKAERLWIADKALGDAGLDLVNVLGKGRTGLEALGEAAIDSGYALEKGAIASARQATLALQLWDDRLMKVKTSLAEVGSKALVLGEAMWKRVTEGDAAADKVWADFAKKREELIEQMGKDLAAPMRKSAEELGLDFGKNIAKGIGTAMESDPFMREFNRIRSEMTLMPGSGLDRFQLLQAGIGSKLPNRYGASPLDEFKRRGQLVGSGSADDPVFGEGHIDRLTRALENSRQGQDMLDIQANQLRELRDLNRTLTGWEIKY